MNRGHRKRPVLAGWMIAGIAACSSCGEKPVAYTKIDDMEGSTGVVEWAPDGGTHGNWFSFVDTQCNDILPLPDYAGGRWSYEPVPEPYPTLGGIMSFQAARLRTTSPLVNQWGAGMGFNLLTTVAATGPQSPVGPVCPPAPAGPSLAVDLRRFRGISFWAMALGPGTRRVWVQIDDSSTHPNGGSCDPVATDNPRTACFNAFSYPIDLTNTFTQYTVDFSRLKQAAYGYQRTPSVLDLASIYDLEFVVRTPGGFCPPTIRCAGEPATLTFDIWIDDLYFVDE